MSSPVSTSFLLSVAFSVSSVCIRLGIVFFVSQRFMVATPTCNYRTSLICDSFNVALTRITFSLNSVICSPLLTSHFLTIILYHFLLLLATKTNLFKCMLFVNFNFCVNYLYSLQFNANKKEPRVRPRFFVVEVTGLAPAYRRKAI